MKAMRKLCVELVLLPALAIAGCLGMAASSASGAEAAPAIAGVSKPQAGDMQILFKGGNGPFTVQKRLTLDAGAPWLDMPTAKVTQVNTGVFVAFIPLGEENAMFYRVVSAGETLVELKGWTLGLKVSAPANGTHFVAGEAPVVTVSILDNFAAGMTKTSFSSLALYMYGPEDPLKTVTPLMLGANMGRSGTHHYIDLAKDARVSTNGNTLAYTLQPVTTEAPGTYTIAVRSVLSADGMQQVVKYSTVQIGTSTVESKVVSNAKCASCHQGTVSGKMYLHHADVSSRSPFGSWIYDLEPERSCKMCHNNDGYASFIDPSTLGTGTTNRVVDHILIRVHGVHMGEGLKNYWNTNHDNGAFADYTHVVFPAFNDLRGYSDGAVQGVPNCTSCHTDDRWKTKPSRLACGTCHDNVYFGSGTVPTNMVEHFVRPITDDSQCGVCHLPDTESDYDIGFGGIGIAERHTVLPPKAPHPTNVVEITLSAPANGAYYVAGEKPVASIVIKNDAGVSIGDHTAVTAANFAAANFYVYGPRNLSVPVLTSKARAGADVYRPSVTCSVGGPWNINGKVFKIAINGSAPQDITITGTPGAVTAAEVVTSLNAVIGSLNGGAVASVSSGKVKIQTLIRGSNARIAIYNGEVTTAMGWKAAGVTLDPDVTVAAGSTVGNDLRPVTSPNPLDWVETNVVLTTTNILYQLGDVAGLAPGTYFAFAYCNPKAGNALGILNPSGLGFTQFQVGTATVEKPIASNCADCHGETIFHLYEAHVHPAQFNAEQCKACHDYGHEAGGEMFKNQGGTSLNGWSGFGAMPISRRVHAVHYAHYLEHSEEIYANATKETFGGIIFPQDIRNCTKCHAQSDTWKQKPSRVACMGCHDSDSAKTHGKLMTFMPDASDPYGSTAYETCVICHGAGTSFSPDKVHSISNPYVPPYPREPAE